MHDMFSSLKYFCLLLNSLFAVKLKLIFNTDTKYILYTENRLKIRNNVKYTLRERLAQQ